ncbi:hypothetical protein [Mesorhizobium sp.]|nr:hypothetical protein [Mesorhizobium sp.]
MADGRIYASEDNWITVYRMAPGKIRKAPEKEAKTIRLLVTYGAAFTEPG